MTGCSQDFSLTGWICRQAKRYPGPDIVFAINNRDGFSPVSCAHPENNILFRRKLFHKRISLRKLFAISQLIRFSVNVIYYC